MEAGEKEDVKERPGDKYSRKILQEMRDSWSNVRRAVSDWSRWKSLVDKCCLSLVHERPANL